MHVTGRKHYAVIERSNVSRSNLQLVFRNPTLRVSHSVGQDGPKGEEMPKRPHLGWRTPLVSVSSFCSVTRRDLASPTRDHRWQVHALLQKEPIEALSVSFFAAHLLGLISELKTRSTGLITVVDSRVMRVVPVLLIAASYFTS
jgi:hypothetical protein